MSLHFFLNLESAMVPCGLFQLLFRAGTSTSIGATQVRIRQARVEETLLRVFFLSVVILVTPPSCTMPQSATLHTLGVCGGCPWSGHEMSLRPSQQQLAPLHDILTTRKDARAECSLRLQSAAM